MSSGIKRPYATAYKDAEDFREMLGGGAIVWEIAGSIRRRKPEVGDVEHVCIPDFVESTSGNLFGGTEKVNALWQRLDALVESGELQRALYVDKNEAVTQRWGEKYRGVMFRGMKHEIFTADPENWGAQLLIRTGSAEFSKRVVDTILRAGMYRQMDGHLVHVASGAVVPVPDEETFLKFAGMKWIPPEQR